ncbi:MAG TPA: hypothetical protein VFH01_05030, partial [Pyrinomonadaceae bacterium]|nr:hypothetical protein [Pyrinomonadaceae bacterium]
SDGHNEIELTLFRSSQANLEAGWFVAHRGTAWGDRSGRRKPRSNLSETKSCDFNFQVANLWTKITARGV